ncbi:MAG: UDP-N-acetylglucosamine 1-carboxyvinyltransferase [Actinomycetota bacterium]
MSSYLVRGGNPLQGSVRASGAKNSALKLMVAALLAPGETVLDGAPDIADVATMCEVLAGLGAGVSVDEGSMRLEVPETLGEVAPYELVRRMRASIIVLGPLLSRNGHARVAMPGGCNIGTRKIDLHLAGLERMGVQFSFEHGYLDARATRLRGASLALDFPSVGATENLLMAAVTAQGSTVLDNAAREPEIVDLARFLKAMGARIEGEGGSRIEIEGVDALRAVRYRVMPDRIEAGTFAIGAVLTGGDVTVEGGRAEHLEMALDKLEEAGAKIDASQSGFRVVGPGRPRGVDVATLPYPGFPTDLQPQMMVLLSIAEGTSIVSENVFESRFMFVDELNRMGSDIRTESHHALVRGVERLSGAPVRATDLRAGAALVLAGLVAEGATEVGDIFHIERGYERFPDKLRSLGADLSVVAGNGLDGKP